jgi:V/A-type H+-transporting ATPase subunit K
MTDTAWAMLGAALAVAGGGMGSAIGITYASNMATGVLSEDPDKFAKMMAITVLPGTQGIYGFVAGFLTVLLFDLGGAGPKEGTGILIFAACLPVAFVCLVSAIYQGLTGVGSIGLVAKQEEALGKAIIFPALVETYAVISLVFTLLVLFQLPTS